jgi:maltose alpha-D-glucosyltransferase/alpha-amylase
VFLGDRNGVRTPMQWSPDRNAGFSRAEPESLYLPPIMDSIFGFEAVNVESQRRLSTSLLNWMKRLISVRKAHPSFGRGSLNFLYPGNRKVFAYLRSYEGETVLCVGNLSQAPQPAELDLSAFRGRVPVELLGKSAFPPIGDLPYFITLPRYGFYWFLLAEEAEAPRWYEGFVTPLPEFRTLVLRPGWENVITGGHIQVIEERVLPEFLPNQRWFAAKGGAIRKVSMKDSAVLLDGGNRFRLACFDAEIDNGSTQLYFLPLTIAWETASDDPMSRLAPYVLAKARAGGQVGAIHDALATPYFTEAVIRGIREGWQIETSGGGRMVFSATDAFAEVELPDDVVIERMGREQSNTSVMIGEQMILKALRRLEPGVHPEIEIGRFLTNVAHFSNSPPLLGALELIDSGGTPTALAVLQGFVRNQGDGWSFTEDYLHRIVHDLEIISTAEESGEVEPHAMYVGMARTLGNRVADLHRAFAIEVDDPAFRPEPASPRDLEAWGEQVREQASAARSALTRSISSGDLSEDVHQQVEEVLSLWPKIGRLIDQALPKRLKVMKTRHHGDLHLGQVVVVREDFFILDFEGEPVRTMEQRRSKHSPLRDVAGIIRSFNYAALTASHDHIASRPDFEEQLETAMRQFEELATAHFLEGYRETINGCSSVPEDPKAFQRLLNLFVLEKALYEVCYEAANRPDWLRIPLTGVQRLIASAA